MGDYFVAYCCDLLTDGLYLSGELDGFEEGLIGRFLRVYEPRPYSVLEPHEGVFSVSRIGHKRVNECNRGVEEIPIHRFPENILFGVVDTMERELLNCFEDLYVGVDLDQSVPDVLMKFIVLLKKVGFEDIFWVFVIDEHFTWSIPRRF